MKRVAALVLVGSVAFVGCSSDSGPSRAAKTATGSSAGSSISSAEPSSSSAATSAVSSNPPFAPGAGYVALGDSYTAGPLIYQATQPLDCGRSTNNYPNLIARLWKMKLTDVSCSGNTTADVTNAGRYPAQLSAVTAETKLVTLSIGGNDGTVFGNLVVGCATQGGNCPSSDTAARGDLMDKIDARVRNILKLIRQKAPHAQTYVIGYPTILGDDASCIAPKGTDPTTAARAGESAISQLNSALSDAAKATDATFIDITGLTKDHSICAKDPWINGTAFSDDGAPVHPRAAYMHAVAAYVAQQIAR